MLVHGVQFTHAAPKSIFRSHPQFPYLKFLLFMPQESSIEYILPILLPGLSSECCRGKSINIHRRTAATSRECGGAAVQPTPPCEESILYLPIRKRVNSSSHIISRNSKDVWGSLFAPKTIKSCVKISFHSFLVIPQKRKWRNMPEWLGTCTVDETACMHICISTFFVFHHYKNLKNVITRAAIRR